MGERQSRRRRPRAAFEASAEPHLSDIGKMGRAESTRASTCHGGKWGTGSAKAVSRIGDSCRPLFLLHTLGQLKMSLLLKSLITRQRSRSCRRCPMRST